MPFGMGPAGWAYVSPYTYSYARLPYPVWQRSRLWLALFLALLESLVVTRQLN